jgi:nucleoside-diphosphate-sugar epimerase
VNIFVAGATGTIGRRLVPLLVEAGHEVTGMSRDPERAVALEALGARGVVGDVYDRGRLDQLLAAARPDVVIDELSDLGKRLGPRGSGDQFAANNRIRTEGARNLAEAALQAGTRRIVAQSYAHVYAPRLGWIKGEDDPLNLDPDVPEARRRNAESVRELERIIMETPGIEGVALRYGAFYGPGTPFASDGSIAAEVRKRHYPIIGNGQGRTSFVHVDDAAAATLLALAGRPGVYNVCDDRPAMEREWVPFYASTIEAPPPRHVFAFVVTALGREHFVYRATQQRGASNAKAKAVLGWQLRYPSWREGFLAEARAEQRAARQAA